MASIYDTVSNWDTNVSYNKFQPIKYNNKYYYSLIENNITNNPGISSNLQTKWDGYILLNGQLIPNFFWKPSYNISAEFSPEIIISQFGNGYQQRSSAGINPLLARFSLMFENRSERETVSILHFLKEREGKEAFIYNPPTIYQKPNNEITTKYASVSWKSSYISYNIYNIEAGFVEVPA